MKTFLLLFISILGISATAFALPLGSVNALVQDQTQSASLASPVFLTANSIRRDPTPEEMRPIVSIVGDSGTCTGFFVANVRSEFYVATARHCANFEPEKNCAAGELFAALTVGSTQLYGKCKEIISGTPQDDIFIMRIEFADAGRTYQATDDVDSILKERIQFLNLASYTVPSMSRMKTIGFPIDTERQSRATVTENCWDTSDIGFDFSTGSATSVLGGNASNVGANARDRFYLRQLRRVLRWNNCSNWGGNSGGPLILENTDHVVGIPGAYDPSMRRGTVYPQETTSSFYETTAGFVARNRESLQSAGVIIATQPPEGVLERHRARTQQWIRSSGYRTRR